MYCDLQGPRGEQGKPGLAGRQGAKVLSNGLVVAFEDEDKVCLGVNILFYLSPCIQYDYLKDDK